MLLKPTAKAPRMENRGGDKSAFSLALIGMSLRQDIPGGLLSSRARFRFSCQDHSETKDSRRQQKSGEQRSVPSSRVSILDTAHPRLQSIGDSFGDGPDEFDCGRSTQASLHAGHFPALTSERQYRRIRSVALLHGGRTGGSQLPCA